VWWVPDLVWSAACCMLSPRALVMRTPSSKENAPAKHNAEYSPVRLAFVTRVSSCSVTDIYHLSPNDKPIATVHSSIALGFSSLSFSSAAMLDTNIATCATTVESNSSRNNRILCTLEENNNTGVTFRPFDAFI
jgi:hypothetical protein